MLRPLFIILSLMASVLALGNSQSLFTLKNRFLSSSSDIASVPLTQCGNYFYALIPSDGTSQFTCFSTDPQEDVGVTIALFTNETLLATNCSGFGNSSCPTNPNPPANLMTYDFLYYEAIGYYSSSNLGLDNNQWQLRTDAVTTVQFISNQSEPSSGTNGVIGLGQAGNSQSNFWNSTPVFSIYLSTVASGATLLFGFDKSYASSDTPVAIISSDNNWHVSEPASLQVGGTVYSQLNVIFDLNSGTLAVPLNVYTQLVSQLESESGLSCDDLFVYANCYYSGSNTPSLPSVSLVIGGQTISLPSSAISEGKTYINSTTSSITLNLRAVSSSLTGDSYVTPTYDDTIILGSWFMTQYYTVFSAGGNENSIILYLADSGEQSFFSKIPWYVYFIIGLAIFSLIMWGVSKYQKKKRERIEAAFLESN